MFSKITQKFSIKSHQKNLRTSLDNFKLDDSYSWMAMAINQKSYRNSLLSKEIVLTSSKSQKPLFKNIILSEATVKEKINLSLKIKENHKEIFLQESDDVIQINTLKIDIFNHIDKLFEKEMNYFKFQFTKSDYNPLQQVGELKGIEWFKTTLQILNKAIIESLTNPDYLFQTTIFCGINPKTNLHEFRILCFNLDITYILLENNNLRVIIYNNKNNEDLSKLKPALMGDYSFYKREMFDQLVELLALLSQGIKA